MNWLIVVDNRARRNLKRVPAADQRRLMAALDSMQLDPLSGDVVKLAGQNAFRRRIGNYRIIFRVDFKSLTVGILDIQRRTTTTYR